MLSPTHRSARRDGRRRRRVSPPVVSLLCAVLGLPQGPPCAAQDEGEAPRGKPAPSAQEPADPVRDEILKVNYVFNRGLYDLAIPRYEKLLAESPGYARADLVHYPLALSHYHVASRPPGGEKAPGEAERKDHLRKAVAHLKEALKRRDFESRLEATRLLGQSLLLLEDPDQAAKAFSWVVEKHPRSKEAAACSAGLAECAYLRGDFPRAAALYREAIGRDLEPEEAQRARLQLAMSLYRSAARGEGSAAAGGSAGGEGRLEALREAARIFDELAAIPEGQPGARHAADARYMAALAREASGDAEGAAAALRSLLDSGAGAHAEAARFGLASVLFGAGKHKDAAAELERFLAELPSSPRRDAASLLLARCLLEMKQAAQAARKLQELRASASVGDEASLWLARLYARHGKPRSAVTVLAAAMKSFPKSPLRRDLELEIVSAHLAEGSFEAAEAVLARLEAELAGPGGAAGGGDAAAPDAVHADHVAYLRAYALHRARKLDASREACARFRAAHPRSRFLKDVALLDAESLFLAGDAQGALDAYGAYLERFGADLDGPARLKASYRSAQALLLAGKAAEARGALEALDPTSLGPEAERAFREDPLFAAREYLLGECAYQLKDHAAAVTRLEAFLDAAPEAGSSRAQAVAAELSDARFKLAHALELSGDLPAARAAFERALEADPASPHREQILFELGQILHREKDGAGAARHLSRLLEESPSSRFAPSALRLLGWIASEAKDHAAAAERFRALAEGHPDHALAPEAHYQLALSLEALGKAEEAREVLARFKAKYPGDPRLGRVLLEEASALAKAGKHREALGALERLRASAAPDVLPAVLYEVAWCRRALGEPEEAAKAYRAVLGLEAAGDLAGPARVELGELELERKEYAAAKEALAPLASGDGPHREKALYRLAWCRHFLDEPDGVVAAHAALAKAFPSSALLAETALLAAKAHLKRGETAKAGEVFRSIAEARPGTPEAETALVSLGECLAEERRFEEAGRLFAEILERHPESPHAYRARFGRAWALENLGKPEEAMSLYRKVASETKSATGARAQFQLGQCHAARKEHRDAIVELLQVSARFAHPEWSAKALLQAAGCFEAIGDDANARKHYAEVIATFPDRDEAKLARERLERLDSR
ncbi:MAG: tetratricopeptide repeat protein [Planctomycetes bacterium]|nr:tetratricopeptide repeat protein [Planctomycetota bacterium]